MVRLKKVWCSLVIFFVLSAQVFLQAVSSSNNKHHTRWKTKPAPLISSLPVQLHIVDQYVVLDNGIVNITLQNPTGWITGIQYNGIDNLLEFRNKESRRGYWDIVWDRPGQGRSNFDTLEGSEFRVIVQNDDQIEVSFSRTWNSSTKQDGLPLNFDKRFILLRGSSGFYSYAIFEHLKGWPALNIDEGRIAFKLQQKLFRYMAISDSRQRIMPSYQDIESGRMLDYKEARLLINPENQKLRGQVDDKYQYSCDNKDNRVHGWISSTPRTGFWVITPSNEFRNGGPLKQDLTSHSGPTSLAIYFNNHYAGPDAKVSLQDGEEWKKVFGPNFIYLNSDTSSDNPMRTLWEDAEIKMLEETKKLPYEFPMSRDFQHANERGAVTGRLMVNDRYIHKDSFSAKAAYVGLAAPAGVGSWQTESKGYQFWSQADEDGNFRIDHVHTGNYNLYAWVPRVIGDYKYGEIVKIGPGSEIRLGHLIYKPPRNGPTVWEIGIPDRTAAEFFVPDPAPRLQRNPLYANHDKFRQYGLWNGYTDLYPIGDLIYNVGKSNYRKDWFFAHVNRRTGNNTYVPTTWQIKFDLRDVDRSSTYTLRIALASSTHAQLHVWINNPRTPRPHFATRHMGRDNAIARHGIHGLYSLLSFEIPGYQLVKGRNTVFIKQTNSKSPFSGVMYDYIRLEGPSYRK